MNQEIQTAPNQQATESRTEQNPGRLRRVRRFRLLSGLLAAGMMVAAGLLLPKQAQTPSVTFLNKNHNMIQGAHPGIVFPQNPVKLPMERATMELSPEQKAQKELSVSVWDYSAVDGDSVQLLHNGVPLGEPLQLSNVPKIVKCPPNGTLTVRVISPGSLSFGSYGLYISGSNVTFLNLGNNTNLRDCNIEFIL